MKNKKIILVILAFFLLFTFYFLLPTYAYASDLEKEISNNPPNPPLQKGGEGGFSDEIKAIEVEGVSRIEKEELIDMICFRIGDILDKKIFKDGIKRAFKKGIFLDIKAETEPYESGIKLKYIVKEIPIIRHVTMRGNKLISKRKIKKFFIFKEGEGFKEGYLDKAKSELINFYSRKGFPDARVTLNIEKDRSRDNVDITVHIEEGEPLIIRHIIIPPDVQNIIRISEGDIFDRDQVETAIKRLKNYYKGEKYYKPLVGSYEFKDGDLIIPVEPGPRLEVAFKGNEVFSSKELLKYVPFFEDEEVNSELIEEVAKSIKERYQGKGYYYAQVAGGIEREEDLIKITFFIFEGRKVYLREIHFEGINIFPHAIKAVMPLEENKVFDETLLDTSKESIIRFYNALGYLHAYVTEIKKDFIRQGDELNLVFVIHEGPQVIIKEINITGNKDVSTPAILNVLSVKKEAPYNETDIEDARYRLLSFYSRYGYIDARVEIESVIDADRASVTFKITENRPYTIGKIIIRGNEKTKDKIIRREFDIKEGEPYNYEAVLKTKQRLYRLGLFDDISIEPLKRTYSKPSSGELEEVYTQDVLVDLKEGNPGAVEIGLGYGDYEQLRGFLDIGYRNLGGYNRQIGLRTELSSVKKRLVLNFREPRLFNRPLPLNVSLTKENIRSINLDTKDLLYKIDRLSLLVGTEKEFTRHLKAGLNYEYSLVETTDVKPGIILSREDTGTLGIGSISPSLFYDTRDNPFDPTKGSLNGIVLKYASSLFFSETEFIKAVLQSSWYFQLRKGLIAAFSLKGGLARSFGASGELPLVERFFLGGRSTVRGYTQDTLGPKGTGDVPTGGNAFALVNTEIRISLGKGFGVVTFVDAGNVWQKTSDMESGLHYTAGLGLRYNTPVGPIRVDYGHKLNRERREESSGEIHFSLGHAF